ncbi:MAG: translocase [Alphaproteobacteria bacterium]|nr:MAG: translocase [Alphaproteobacteria bacterium]
MLGAARARLVSRAERRQSAAHRGRGPAAGAARQSAGSRIAPRKRIRQLHRGGAAVLRQITSPFAVGVGARLAAQLIAFATVILAARYLTLADFGAYALAWAVTVILATFVFSGLHQALLRSRDLAAELDTLFWLMAAVGATGTAVMLVGGFASGGNATALGRMFWSLAAIPLLQAPVSWLEAQLVRQGRVRAAAIVLAGAELAGLAVAAAALEAGLGDLALALGRHAMVLAALAMTLALVRRLPRPVFRRDRLGAIGATVAPLWTTSTLAMFSNYGADLVLGAFLNPAAVGAYRSGARIATTLGELIVQPLTRLSWPRFARLEKEENGRSRIRAAWLENMAVGAMLLWPIACGLSLLATELVEVTFGRDWSPAAPVVAILALARALRLFSALLEPALICTGHSRSQLRIRIAAAALLLALLLGFGRLGAREAALAQLCTAAALAAMALPVQARRLGITAGQMWRCFFPGLALTLVCAGAIILTAPLRSALPGAPGFLATLALLATIWTAAIAAALRSGRIALPTP